MVSTKLPFYEIEPGIFEIDEFDCVSIFVIVGQTRALVIDTGTGIGDLKWVIENKITQKPYDVVISHNHGDHAGGAGFFPEVWVHQADMDWNTDVSPTLEFRRQYAATITRRENKTYDYNPVRDVRPWPAAPRKHPLSDGHVFDLGGRTVTAHHCPGHTAGEMVFIDSQTRTLFLADACNCNLLLGRGFGQNARDEIRIAKEALERLQSRQDQDFTHFYNAHHDFRGFGQTLYPHALTDAIACYQSLLTGTATFLKKPDPLFPDNPPKVLAQYGKVSISYITGDISHL